MQRVAEVNLLPEKSRAVAIVDDESSVRVGLKRLLETSGFKTEVFSSGEALLERESLSDLSCIVLDINLGGISGIEVRRRLSEKGCRIPVIFITALDNAPMRKEAAQVGYSDFLGKPFSGHTLVRSIRHAIQCE